jgi:phosphopantetheine adenylyltransferase
MPPRELCEVSSSLVKGLIGPDGWEEIVCQYVPKPVFDKLKENHDGKQNK